MTRGGQFGQGQCRTVFLFVLFCFVCLRCLEICTHGHEAVLVDGFGFSCWLALVGSSEVVGPSTAGLGKPSCPQGVGASSSTSKKRQWKSRTGQLRAVEVTDRSAKGSGSHGQVSRGQWKSRTGQLRAVEVTDRSAALSGADFSMQCTSVCMCGKWSGDDSTAVVTNNSDYI